MMNLAIGTALIAVPSAKAAVQALRGARRKRREGRSDSDSRLQEQVEASVTLKWSHLSCTLTTKDGSQRALLQQLHGQARSGRLLALCGPSGSGKTTMLQTLSGQLPYSPKLSLEGYVTANDSPVPAPGIKSGFVAQEDLFFSQLTVRETLLMTAEMRMPPSTSAEERAAAVEAALRRLGLAKCADTAVGDAKTRGLSGGEKKRLSIACELIARPQLIMLDEPTSGLDAFAAQQVMASLRDLAADGHTVITSIHQPRSSIFAMFDDLCLLSEGQLVYMGPAADAVQHFAALGHECPEHFNPAEFLADLVAIDHSNEASEAETSARVQRLVQAWREANPLPAAGAGAMDATGGAAAGERAPACGLGRQAALLFQRSWRQVTRDRATAASRAASQVSSAVVFSAIYWRLGKNQAAIQDRMGLLQVSAVGTAMSSLIKTLNVFPRERTIVQRERARAAYPVLPYLLSKLAAELPVGAIFPALFGTLVYPATGLNPNLGRFARFLGVLTAESFAAQALGLAVGAAAPSTEAALAIGPAVILVSIVFGGLFVNDASVPTPLKWLPKTSLIKHAFEGACVNEFTGATFEPREDGSGETTGEAVLKRLAFENDNVAATLVNQGKIILFYWWCTYRILKAKKPRYQPLVPPGTADKPGEGADAGSAVAEVV